MTRAPSCRHGGQALVEFAIILPILLLMFMGAVDLGRALFVQVALEEAAQEGVVYASHNPKKSGLPSSAGTIEYRATRSSDATEVRNATVTYSCGTNVSVRLAYSMPVLTPGIRELLGGSVLISASATATRFGGSC
jgi:Flp pilus assembly protein TadG